ncbi:MAG TPA: tetratricopeptide repeat protein [Bacteroidales bacterium]|nr:tetratricopeptide repeat protein [Bacteroidales bacterium]HRR93795.1 tetratricopeptide repeat protein [Bacteroidales bacterium]HRT90031.1 tetratricopeptide repeat protein [Bacteroidales bacterium]
MKRFKSLLILVVAAVFLAGCSGLSKMKKNSSLVKYDVTPKVLETHAGQVDVSIKGTFPQKYFDKKTVLEITPVLVYEGGETAYKPVKVQGESVQANNEVISYNGDSFTYTDKVAYKKEMKKSELVVRIKATRGKTVLDFDPVKIADGVIATSTLVDVHGSPVLMPDNYQRIIPDAMMADIHYLINQYDLRSSELKAEDITLLKEYIKKVNEDPRKQFKGTEISSYASPDGKLDLNEKLSVNRGGTADKFIRSEFAKIEAAKAANFFNAKTTAEDWDGFRAEVEKSNIQDKDLILRVLSMYSDPEVREKEIRNMAAAFEVLKTDILPRLRRSKMTVNVDLIGRSDEEIIAQYKSDPKVLTLEEILHAGALVTDMNEKLAVYQAAAQQFPTCIRAHNNIGYCYIALGKADEALAALDKAKAINNNDVVKNNIGAAYLLKGDIAKAEEVFNSMSAATAESKHALGAIAITKGQYDAAVNYLTGESCFNLALAQVLKGDAARAKITLDGIKELCKCGKPSYLKAVVGARLDDRNYAMNGLREAIGFKADWKAYAKTDLELAKYWNDDTFKSAVQ